MNRIHRKLQRLLALGPRIRLDLRRRGLKSFIRRATVKIAGRLGGHIPKAYLDWIEYQEWVGNHTPSTSALAAQRRWARTTPDLPVFTLVLRTDPEVGTNLSRTLRSLRRQTYSRWSTVLLSAKADASAVTLSQLGSDCDFVGIMRAGDTLSPEALYEFARAITNRDQCPDVLYCDEDRLAKNGRTRFSPIFKPSWSPAMLFSYHYTGRLTLARRTLVEEVGGFNPSLGDAAEWDLILRLSERTDRIIRIPLCLYHNGSQIRHSDDVHRKTVLESHLARIGIDESRAVEQRNSTFRVTWPLKHSPRVSVIIPTVDSPDLIGRCVDDLLRKTDYPNKEIILVDNGSSDPRTLELYERWKTSDSVSIISFDRPFNYSAACNLGAAAAHGEYLLFLNNDMEVIHADWLQELVRWGQLPGTGVVGTKLIYPNGMIQHAGGFVTETTKIIFAGEPDDVGTAPTEAIFGTPNIYRNAAALVGACQLMNRAVFDEIGGYDERSLIVCSDDIICLEAHNRGFRNLYTPYAALIHHGAMTRGPVEPSDDYLLLAQVLDRLDFQEDPFFHPELDPRATSPTLRPAWIPTSKAVLCERVEKWTTILRVGPWSPYEGSSAKAFLRKLTHHSYGAHWSAEEVGRDTEAATSFVIDLLLQDEGLTRQYPRALTEGADGDFCRWLCSEGIDRYGLPPESYRTIRAAFTSQPGEAVRLLIEYQGRDNPSFRVARIPSLIKGLLFWLVEHGKQHGVTDRQVWWFLLESAEDPIRELVRVYMSNPDWQKYFPDAMSPTGWKRLTHWLRERYSLDVTGCDYQSRSPSGVRQETCSMPVLFGRK